MRIGDVQAVGAYTGSDDLMAMLAQEGFGRAQQARNAEHSRRVNEAARLFGDVMSGREDAVLLREAFMPRHDYIVAEIARRYPGVIRLNETMSVTDFQALTVDVLDRMLWGYWNVSQIPNKALVKEVQLRDFRTVKRYGIDGAVKPFEKSGNPAEPPAQRSLKPMTSPTDPVTYAPDLYQGYMSVNWRALVNDDLGIFNDLVQRLSDSWNLTVWKAITSLYVDTSGPHASLYNAGFSNLITTAYGAATSNPPLSFQGLIDGLTVLDKQLNPDGQPFNFAGSLYLWYGPSLKMTAMALLKAIQADISVGGGTTNAQGFPSQRLRVAPDYVTANITPIEDKYIPLVCTASGIKNTMWGLTYEPARQPRPSIEFGVLRGYEQPQLFQKVPNTQRVGGGVDPTMGDFLTMDNDYKAIAVFGGTQGDGRSTVASTGAGS